MKAISLSPHIFLERIFQRHFEKISSYYQCPSISKKNEALKEAEIILVAIGNKLDNLSIDNLSALNLLREKFLHVNIDFLQQDKSIFEKFHSYLSQSNLPIKYLWEIDSDYWMNHYYDFSNQYNEPSYHNNADFQYDDMEKNFTRWATNNQQYKNLEARTDKGNWPSKELKISYIPYAENALINLLEIICDKFAGLAMNIYDNPKYDYANAFNSMYEGKIDLVFASELIENPPSSEKEIHVYRSDRPLLTYNNYHMLVSTDVLSKLLLLSSTTFNEINLINLILDSDDVLSIKDIVYHTELLSLFKKLRVTTWQNTDTSAYFNKFIKNELKDKVNIVDLDPDTGIKDFIDGEIGFYIGGALQSHYALKVFPHKIKKLFIIEAKLDLYLYTCIFANNENIQGINNSNMSKVLAIWDFVIQTWNNLNIKSDNYRKSQSEKYDFLKKSLVANLNCKRENSVGLVRDFEHLYSIIDEHDLLNSDQENTFKKYDFSNNHPNKQSAHLRVVRN